MASPIVQVALPLALAFMMLTMGLGLTFADFRAVVLRPKAFLTGFFNQVLALPLVTFGLASISSLEPELTAGFIILAACPGGVSSNILTHFAKGDLALSISLTAVVSLIGFVTVPFIVSLGLSQFVGEAQAIQPPASLIAGSVFAITLLPVGIGMGINRAAPAFSEAIYNWMNRLSALLFAVVVVGAITANWTLFLENFATLGFWTLSLNVLMMTLGFASAWLLNLETRQAVSISIETGVQNAAMGLVIATSLLGSKAMALPSAMYGVMMYLPAFGLIALLHLFRRGPDSSPTGAETA